MRPQQQKPGLVKQRKEKQHKEEDICAFTQNSRFYEFQGGCNRRHDSGDSKILRDAKENASVTDAVIEYRNPSI